MSDPNGYTVNYSFGDYQANSPTSPLPGLQVDNELAAVATAVAELVAALKNVRRSDGALQNNIVTFESLASELQLTFDPTNGQLVADAVATAQASAAAASASNTSAAGHDTAAAASAVAAAASAAGVNLALYLSKAGNLAGMGSNDTALANLGAMKVDGSTATGRIASYAGAQTLVTDWNNTLASGWYYGFNAANQPVYAGLGDWIVQCISYSTLYVTQIAYPFTASPASTGIVVPFRRQGYNNAGVIAWTAWESQATVPVGSTIWVNATTAPAGFVKENGALLARATYPALYAYAAASGNIVSEATWSAGNRGAFSTGDLSTTFRIPDSRGEFVRGFDDGRGIDAGRVLGADQADSLKDHTHLYDKGNSTTGGTVGAGVAWENGWTATASGSPSTGAATETRPRNHAKLACMKY